MRLYERGRGPTRATSTSGGASHQHGRRPSHDQQQQQRRSFSPYYQDDSYSPSSPELQHDHAKCQCSQSARESGSRSLGMRSTERRELGRSGAAQERYTALEQSTGVYGSSRVGFVKEEEEIGRQQLRRKAPTPRDQQRPPLRFPYPSAPDPISHTYGANSPPIIPRHSHSHPHPSTSQQHRRASSPPPLKPRPRPPPPPGLSKSPQIFGYQLELPSPQLVPYLIGPRGERSSAIREPAGLVELTLGYLATTLTPVARLQGTYSSIHRGIQGIQDCLRQHPNPNLLGDLESWCDWDPRAMWDMGVPIEMYSCLPPTKKGGVVRPMEGLEEGHPFAEGMVTRLPEKMDIGLEVGIRKGRGKRRYEEIEDQGRERKVSRTTGSGFPSTKNYDHGYYEDPVRHSRRPLPPQRLPSPTSFRHLPSEQVNSHPRRPSSPLPAPSPVFPPSRLPFSSTYISELPSSTSRETISTEATELLPSSLGDEAQQALRLLRNLPAEQRVQLWGTDPLRSSFNSREPSPAFADSLDRRQDEDEDKSRRSPVFKKEEMSVEGDRRVLAGGEEHGWPIGSAGASEDGEVEEGEIRSSRAGSMMREDRTSEQEPGLVRDRTYEEEEEGDRASPLTEEGDTWEQDVKMADESYANYTESILAAKLAPRIERSASVVSFLDYNC